MVGSWSNLNRIGIAWRVITGSLFTFPGRPLFPLIWSSEQLLITIPPQSSQISTSVNEPSFCTRKKWQKLLCLQSPYPLPLGDTHILPKYSYIPSMRRAEYWPLITSVIYTRFHCRTSGPKSHQGKKCQQTPGDEKKPNPLLKFFIFLLIFSLHNL